MGRYVGCLGMSFAVACLIPCVVLVARDAAVLIFAGCSGVFFVGLQESWLLPEAPAPVFLTWMSRCVVALAVVRSRSLAALLFVVVRFGVGCWFCWDSLQAASMRCA